MRRAVQTLLRGRFFWAPCLAAASLVLGGCQSSGGLWGPLGATAQAIWAPAVNWDRLPADKDFLLLRVQRRDALMALGERAGDAPDEHWFSAQREWLHLRGGRIWAVAGMTHEWRGQRSQPPAWAQVDAGPVRWVRERDEMPHYRFGVRDEVLTRAVPAPASGWHPQARPQPHWRWYEDEVRTTDATGQPWVFGQRFAVVQGRVVYSEQCIAPQWCFQMLPRAAGGAGS